MKYRPEVDGLRAVAVLPVMFFHGGFSSFSGGYVGVDVFFVISGYLITSLIVLEHQEGRFSIIDFYDRRVRRIIPALFFIAMCALPFAIWLFPASQLRSFANALVATFAFASNILFWRKVDYFNPETESNPLIHTWSLAVEEQYYVFFPLMIMALWRFGLARIFAAIGVLLFASLVCAEIYTRSHPQLTFYLLPFRAWELLTGSLAAIYLVRNGQPARQANEWLAAAGLAMILAAIFLFTENTPFPGLYAVVPVLGAGLVIVFATPSTLVGRLLGSAPFVGIGLISYSAYLWHQPIFAFYRVQTFTPTSAPGFLVAIALALALAYLTWRFVERPFRRRSGAPRFKAIGIATGVSALAIATGVAVGIFAPALAKIGLTPAQVAILDYTSDASRQRYRTLYQHSRCFLREDQRYRDLASECFSSRSPEDEVVLWGDSHAASFFPAFKSVYDDRLTHVTGGGCTPVVGLPSLRKSCLDLHDGVIAYLTRRKPKRVIMPGRWGAVAERPQFDALFASTLDALAKAGVREIILLGPMPEWSPSNPEQLARRMPASPTSGAVLLSSGQPARLGEVDMRLKAMIAEAATARGGAVTLRYHSMVDTLCETARCVAGLPGASGLVPISWDYGHLTEEGADYVLRKSPEILR